MSIIKNTILSLVVLSCFMSIAPAVAGCKEIYDEAAYGEKRAPMLFLVEGADGYLFISKKDMIEDYTLEPDTLVYAKRLQKILRNRGMNMVMVVQPTRGLVHQNKISAADKAHYQFDATKAHGSFATMIKTLQDQGLLVATLPNLNFPNYAYMRDHHWTALGAKQVALDVARVVKAQDFYKSLPKQTFVTDKVTPSKGFRGSLANTYEEVCHQKLPLEKLTEYKTIVAPLAGKDQSSALFGEEQSPPVVLMGTSFSSNEAAHANFDGWLKEALSLDVLNYSVRGGGLNSSLLLYFVSKEYREKKQSLMVWEMPSYLRFGGSSLWREIVPAAVGDCKGTDKEMYSDDISLSSEKGDIFDDDAWEDFNDKAGKGDGYYLVLSFDKDLDKSAKLEAMAGEKKLLNVNLSHSNRMGENLSYFVDMGPNFTMDKVSLSLNKKDVGRTVTVRACKY